MTKILRTTLFATLVLAGTNGLARAQGLIQPIFSTPDAEKKINNLVRRVTDDLGGTTLDTKKIADNLDKGFQFAPPGAPSGVAPAAPAANKTAGQPGGEPNILFVAQKEEPKAPAAPENGNGNNVDGFKGTIDAINGIFKMQADAIRSIDLKGGRMMPLPENGSDTSLGPGATGRVGFRLANLPPEVSAQLKLPPDVGLLVKEVFAKTPAEAAGYKKNDVLISFGGRDVPANVLDFMDKNFRFVKPNTPVAGIVVRAGEKVTIDDLKITDRRVVPALPGERAPDYTHLIQIAPGINSVMPNTIRIPEIRTVPRGGGIADIVIVNPNGPPKK